MINAYHRRHKGQSIDIKIKSIKIWIVNCLIGSIGALFWGYPADPDVSFSNARLVGVFLIFTFFLVGMIGWGELWTKILKLEEFKPLSPLLFGTIGAMLVIPGTITVFGFFFEHKADQLLILLISVGPLFWDVIRAEKLSPNSKSILTNFLLVIALFCVCMRVLSAFLPHGTSDPFLYHLLAPRLWWEQNVIHVPENLTISFQSTLWEYLIYWGNVFFAGPQGRGLIEVQLFAQFLHVFIGLGGSFFALVFVGKTLRLDRVIIVLASIIALSSSSLWHISWIAKNDLGAFFITIGATAFLLSSEELSLNRRWMIFGVLSGFAITTKWNMAVFLIPVAFLIAVYELIRCDKKQYQPLYLALIYGVFFLVIAALPILIRNLVLTQNPFFPMLDHLFQSPMLSANQRRLAQAMIFRNFDITALADSTFRIIKDNFVSLGVALLPIVFIICEKSKNRTLISLDHRKMTVLGIGSFFSYLVFSVFSLNSAHIRWVGPSLFVVPFLGSILLLSVINVLTREFVNEKHQLQINQIFVLILSVGICIDHYRKNSAYIKTVFFGPPTHFVIRNDTIHIGGESMAWIRMNARPTDQIVSTGNAQIYYLSGFHVRVLGEDLQWEKTLLNVNDPAAILEVLIQDGTRYIYDTKHFNSKFWGKYGLIFNALFERFPESIVFRGSGSKVIDANILYQAIKKADLAGKFKS